MVSVSTNDNMRPPARVILSSGAILRNQKTPNGSIHLTQVHRQRDGITMAYRQFETPRFPFQLAVVP